MKLINGFWPVISLFAVMGLSGCGGNSGLGKTAAAPSTRRTPCATGSTSAPRFSTSLTSLRQRLPVRHANFNLPQQVHDLLSRMLLPS